MTLFKGALFYFRSAADHTRRFEHFADEKKRVYYFFANNGRRQTMHTYWIEARSHSRAFLSEGHTRSKRRTAWCLPSHGNNDHSNCGKHDGWRLWQTAHRFARCHQHDRFHVRNGKLGDESEPYSKKSRVCTCLLRLVRFNAVRAQFPVCSA